MPEYDDYVPHAGTMKKSDETVLDLAGVLYHLGRLGYDNLNDYIVNIDSIHHKIHEGNHYYLNGCATLGNGVELRVKFDTADSPVRSHITWDIASSGILTTELWEGATGGMAGGIGVTPNNSDRESPNVSIITLTSGVAVAVSDGALVSEECWGSRTGGGSGSREDEIMMARNTTYLRKFISGASANLVSFKAYWYEL